MKKILFIIFCISTPFLFAGLDDNLLTEARKADLKKVKILLKKGADPDCADGHGTHHFT